MSTAVTAGPRPLLALPLPESEPHALTSPPRPAPLEQVHPAQCALPLALEPPAYRPRVPPPARRSGGGRHPGGVGEADGAHSADEDAPRPTSATVLPDPVPLVGAVVCASIEVLAGSRPAAQLLRWLSPDVYAALQRQAATAARTRRSRGRSAPVRRAAVRRVLTTAPRDGALEAAVVVQEGRRVRAVALRLEGWDGRWRVTALQVG